MIAAIYARYSSDNQREESIVAQIRACRNYCKSRNYTIIKEYADEAMTGTNDNRPQFQQMLADAESGLFEILVAHKVDRLGRNEFDYFSNKDKLNRSGIDVHFAAQGFDSSTPEGALMESTLAGLAAYYSRNLAKEVKKGLRENAYQGKSTGGQPLYGYRYTADKHYEIDETEAIAVRMIFKEYINGTGYIAICRMLNERGFKTRRGNDFSKGSLYEIIRNRRYIGTAILGKNCMNKNGKRNSHRPDHSKMLIVENVCPPIIEKEVFEMAQKQMEKRKHSPASNTKKNCYPLVGLIRCKKCGGAYSGSISAGKSGSYRYYRCLTKSKKGADKCSNSSLSADKVEKIIADFIRDFYLDETMLDNLVNLVMINHNKSRQEKQKELNAIIAKKNGIQHKIQNFFSFIESVGTVDDMQKARYQALKEELEAVEKSIAKTKKEVSVTDTPDKSFIKNFILAHSHIDTIEELEKLAPLFVEKIIVDKSEIYVTFKLELVGAPGGNRTHAFSSGG